LAELVQLYKSGQDSAEVDKVEAFSDGHVGRVSVGADSQASVEGSPPHDAAIHPQTIEGMEN
jgi:hypothetical protein